MTSLIRARAAEHVGVQSTWPLQGAASRFDRFKCLEAVKGAVEARQCSVQKVGATLASFKCLIDGPAG